MFTVITLLTLAIGIGANTAIFSVVSGVLLKPLPYPDPDRLVAVWQKAPGLDNMTDLNASPATYFTYREESRTFQDIGLWRHDSVSVTGISQPEEVEALQVTDGTLPLLGVQPLRGRTFTRQDDTSGSPETALIAYGYWQSRFGGDPSIIGHRIVMDGRAREVIGILPANFRFMNNKPDLVLPFQFDRSKVFIGNFSYQAVARLKPGVTLEQASTDVARMLPMMKDKFALPPGFSLKMLEEARIGPNLRSLKQDVVGNVGKVLWVLMATVGMVLFIACANVSNLLLVRAEGRQQELAIRAAVGAGWAQIARELLIESLTLGIVGGALGVGLAYVGLRLLVFLSPANLPRLDEIAIDPSVLGFAAAVSLAAGLLFGLIPVIKYAGPHLSTALREGGRSLSDSRERHRARSVLVVVQVALALVLLIGSGLMIRTLQALKHVDPGFKAPEQVLTLRVAITRAQVPDAERVVRMDNDIVQRIAAIPGVTSTGLSNSVTMDGYNDNDPIFVEDRPYTEGKIPPIRRFKFIAPGLFKTMGNALLAGRDLTWTDVYDKRPVVLISQNLALEYFANPSAALGKRIRESPKGTWREIIGVVGNERDNGVDKEAPAVVYWPMLVQNLWGDALQVQRTMAFQIRSIRTGSASFLNEVRQAVWSVNPDVTIANVRTLKEIYDQSMARTSFTLVMLAIAGGMALLLGVVGIYGVISYSVSQRTREIGIRIALGAPQGEVRGMFVRHGLLLTGIGVACGLAAATALTQWMKTLLFEVQPVDPFTYVVVSLVLALAALIATYVPARRATVVEPLVALRAE
jgi:predicted permease